jgi:hypothetical protein
MTRDTNAAGGVPVDNCDVQDKAGLRQYRELRTKWLSWLNGDPHHPIWPQIFYMVDNDLAVRTLACAAEHDPDSPMHNRMIAQTIINGHRDAQVLVIRRQMDARRTDVISLGRLLRELRGNVNLFTRENFVSGDGGPYDSSSGPVAVPPAALPSGGSPGTAFVSMNSLTGNGLLAEAAHCRFDRLSQISSAERQRTDRLHVDLIDRLATHVENNGAREIVDWSHKFLAHAGDASAANWRHPHVTFDTIASAQRSIVQVVQLLSSHVLQGAHMGTLVPVAQYNKFDRLDRMFTPEALAFARQRRRELEDDRNSWLQNDRASPNLLTLIGWPDAPAS